MPDEPVALVSVQARMPAVLFGGDYNPEQWMATHGHDEESVWREDMRLMRLAGVNVVTVGVFSWVALQPDEQTYTFGWLDRVLDLLHENGIRVCLATATAAQPAWLSAAYPDALPVAEDGLRQGHGQRQKYCPTSPDFRRLARELTRQLAERYRDHPALLLWHVSNEYYGAAGDNGSPCYCERCAARFRDWLRTRYGSLDALNRRWTTTFWSHTYTDWAQIVPPGPRTDRGIQALLLDWRRFVSDVYLECYLNEAAILRELTPGVPITTNFMGAFKPLDYFAWAPHLDIVSWDSYPRPDEDPAAVAFRHDLMRGLKGGQPFLLMEQTPSQVQWMAHNPLKRPGVMRLLSYQAVARGSDAVMFFQWRQSQGSFEKYHGAIVGHSGRDDTRVFREVAALGVELEALGNRVVGARLLARVALVFSWPNWWNVEFRPGPSNALNYLDEVQRYYRALWERNVPVDVIDPDADLSPYDLVVAPLLNMVSAVQGTAIERYVEDGGTLVTSYFSGVVDENDRVWLGGYPGPLRRTLGIWVEEFDPLLPDRSNTVVVPEGCGLPTGTYGCDLWCDLVHLEGATALARYGEDFYAGRPAITEHRLDEGRAFYVGTRVEPPLLSALVSRLLIEKGIAPPLAAPLGVEVTRRQNGEGTYTFVLNHGDAPVDVPLPTPMQDLLTDDAHQGAISLSSRQVAILVKASSESGHRASDRGQ